MYVSVQENSVVRAERDPTALTRTQFEPNKIVEFVTVKLFSCFIDK